MPYLKWTFAIIPLQAPTSFQANNTYVVYSARGPASCVVSVAFKQSGNAALFQMFGTAANPCASATFSIKLNAYGGVLQTFNSTGAEFTNGGGATGAVCQVRLGSIEWNWCAATLTNLTVSYNAGTIQLKNSGSTWSFLDPIAIDGHSGCGGTTSSTSCTYNVVTTVDNDIIIVGGIARGGFVDAGCVAPGSTRCVTVSNGQSLTQNVRWMPSSSNTNCYNGATTKGQCIEYCMVWASHGTLSITLTPAATGAGFSSEGFGVSGVGSPSCSSSFDPASTFYSQGATSPPTVTGVTFTNAVDLAFGFAFQLANGYAGAAGTLGTDAMTALDHFGSSGAQSSADESLVTSTTYSSVSMSFSSSSSTNAWGMIADAIKGSQVFSFTLTATVSITPAVQEIGTKLLAATVSISETLNAFNMKLVQPSVNIGATILCALNGSDCPTQAPAAIIVGPNIDWIILIPFVMVIFFAILVKRRK